MNLFDQLVQQAMQSEKALGTVRPAVEKELLHHDILREMSQAGLLTELTFIGGTCLRACYGSPRLSEDLDFTGGADFDAARLATLRSVLEKCLMEKYGLPVQVSDPVREEGNVRTWKLRMQTRPRGNHLPAQRIHIDICAIPSHQPRPSLLRNAYGVDMGTEGLIVQVESREEICADKWVALAFRPNRIQYRDLWDLLWLGKQDIYPDPSLIFKKIDDRQKTRPAFHSALRDRIENLDTDPNHQQSFRKEMERFLPAADVREAIQHPQFWPLLINTLQDQESRLA
jgi:predicted nucleotidyltransferase component of viral defense system